MMGKYFVKFMPWNERTLSSLINKEIKFSTVYEFNDFNEYRYLSDQHYLNCNCEVLESLRAECKKICFLNNLQVSSKERCNKRFQIKIEELIKKGRQEDLLNPENGFFPLLCENLAYSNVGIFCVSGIKVFEDDSAQLMFAHYAQNLSGIALIYKIVGGTKIHNVQYENGLKVSVGKVTRCLKWYQGNYEDIEDFLYKSTKWNYEKENRVFDKPGIKLAKDYKITLKAILYTARFSGEEKTLFGINDGMYRKQLVIEKVYPSHKKHYFMMEKDASKTIDFLSGLS